MWKAIKATYRFTARTIEETTIILLGGVPDRLRQSEQENPRGWRRW